MEQANCNHPLDLKDVRITDGSWHAVQETVRTEVLPYPVADAERSGGRGRAQLVYAQL